MPLFIAAGIAAAGAIGGSLITANATSNAADATSAAANTATAEQRRQFDISTANQQPWLTTGQSALGKLAALYGLDSYSNPPPGSANGAPGSPSTGQTPGVIAAMAAGPHSGSGIPLGRAGDPLGLFRQNASPLQDIAAALRDGRQVTPSDWAKAGYGPNGEATGSASAAPAQPGTFTPGSSQPGADPYATFYQSPDYQFRFGQAIKGVDAGASARGYLDSGATRIAEMKRAGDLGAGEFNSYANRLAALAGVGQTTATNLANQGQTYASNVGNIAVNQGNNLASSYLAKGANYGNTIGNLAGIGSGLIQNNPQWFNPAPATYANGNWTPGPGGFPG